MQRSSLALNVAASAPSTPELVEVPAHLAIARYLAHLGATYCFGVSGTSNFKITHSLIKEGVKYVATRHECNAISMADAYAKATRQLTLASVHAGPGLTNAITGMTEAAKSGTPLVVLAGDVPGSDLTSTFYIDQAGLARSIGVTPFRIHSAATALIDTARAVECAMARRSTVLLSLPMDVQYAMVPKTAIIPQLSSVPAPAVPAPATLDDLVQLINSSERPLILAGRGAVISGARDALCDLAEASGGLLANSLQANGIFANNPWSVGIAGGFATPEGAALISECDLVLGFGVSFTYWTARHGALFGRNTTVVQIDADEKRLGIQRPVDMAVVGDARATAHALSDRLKSAASQPKQGWRTEEIRRRVASSWPNSETYEDTSSEEYFDPRALSRLIDEIVPKQRALAIDAGHFMAWPARYIRVPDASASCMSVSFQSIGLGLASAIGMAVANPERLTVLGIGDGGYMMSLADLETATRLGLNMLVVIYDDASYAAEVHPFAAQGYDVDFVKFPDLDLASVAVSLGAKGGVARRKPDLAALKQWVAKGARGVFVLDAKVNPTLEADWHIHVTRGSGH